jgi:hypothetical protein
MSVTISESELKLLQYLHERSGSSGARISLNPRAIMRAFRINPTRFGEDSATLAAHGFAGVRYTRPASDIPSSTCSAIWITSKGEAYLKQSQPRRGVAGISK